jgi:hypothetical protein
MSNVVLPVTAPIITLRRNVTKQKSASDWTRTKVCDNLVSAPVFVGDNISTTLCATPPANHTHPAVTGGGRSFAARLLGKAKMPAITTSPSDARKVGAALARPKYVGKH